jgi:hypothetical protein
VRAATPQQILLGAERYRNDPNRDERYTLEPARWLREERWDDAPLPPRHANVPSRAAVIPQTAHNEEDSFKEIQRQLEDRYGAELGSSVFAEIQSYAPDPIVPVYLEDAERLIHQKLGQPVIVELIGTRTRVFPDVQISENLADAS